MSIITRKQQKYFENDANDTNSMSGKLISEKVSFYIYK